MHYEDTVTDTSEKYVGQDGHLTCSVCGRQENVGGVPRRCPATSCGRRASRGSCWTLEWTIQWGRSRWPTGDLRPTGDPRSAGRNGPRKSRAWGTGRTRATSVGCRRPNGQRAFRANGRSGRAGSPHGSSRTPSDRETGRQTELRGPRKTPRRNAAARRCPVATTAGVPWTEEWSLALVLSSPPGEVCHRVPGRHSWPHSSRARCVRVPRARYPRVFWARYLHPP